MFGCLTNFQIELYINIINIIYTSYKVLPDILDAIKHVYNVFLL